MIYEVINPSDAVTLECDDTAVAAIVSIFLGEGKYPMQCAANPMKNIPLFMFGGFEDWWKAQRPEIVQTPGEFIKANMEKICDTLETCMCMKADEREEVLKVKSTMKPEEWRKHIMVVNDKRRSSMNDICGYAFELAEKLRKKHTA